MGNSINWNSHTNVTACAHYTAYDVARLETQVVQYTEAVTIAATQGKSSKRLATKLAALTAELTEARAFVAASLASIAARNARDAAN